MSLTSMTATSTGPPASALSARDSAAATPAGSFGARLAWVLYGGMVCGVGPSIADTCGPTIR